MNYIKAGKITHFFDKIGVAVLEVTDTELKVGDKIRIGEDDSGIVQPIESMQVEHKPVDAAQIGDEVGMKVNSPVKEKSIVYKIEN